jgi:hypothetical protein
MLKHLSDFWNFPKSSSKCLGLLISRACFIRDIVGFESVFTIIAGKDCDGSRNKSTREYKKDKRKLLVGMAKGKTLNVQGVDQDDQDGKRRVGKKIGRPLKVLSTETTKKALEAAKLGIPLDRIAIGCGYWNNGSGWQQYLARNPKFASELEQARFEGELELTSVVRSCGNGWQGSAWLLERTRGYVARASLEHTGKGGKELSVSGNLLGAFGGQSK